MRFNNQKIKGKVISVYFLFAVILFFSFFSFGVIRKFFKDDTVKYVVLFVILIVTFYLIRKAAMYFEYDSDGQVLVFVNKGVMLSEIFNYRENRAEFPKKKLLYYKMNNYGIYKSLNVYIQSNGDRQKRLKFNITLVSNRKLNYLKQSLDKVIKQNKAKD